MRTSLSVLAGLFLLGCNRGESSGTKPRPAEPPGQVEQPAGGPSESATQQPAATTGASGAESDDFVPKQMPAPPSAPGQRPDASGPEAQRAIFSDYGFPGYPKLEHLCGQRVYQVGGMHLTWDAFSSSDTPAKLIEQYKKRLGENGFVKEGNGGSWKLPNENSPQRVLSVSAASEAGPWKSCGKQPAKSAKTVLMISRR